MVSLPLIGFSRRNVHDYFPQACLALLVTNVVGVMSVLTVLNATISVKANAGSKEVKRKLIDTARQTN